MHRPLPFSLFIAIMIQVSHFGGGGGYFFCNPLYISEVIELKAIKHNDTRRIPPPPPPHPSEKREGKTTPSSVNLKEKAGVPCPFLKKRGHCLKGDKRDFSHKFTLTTQTRVKSKTKSLWKVLYSLCTIPKQ